MPKTSQTKQDARRLGTILVAMFVCAGVSQAWVQTGKRSSIIAEAKKIGRLDVSREEFARRGAIYSQDGKVLAQSNDRFELSLAYKKVPHSEGFFLALSEASGLPANEFSTPAFAGSKSKTWQMPIPKDAADRIQQVKSDWRADGLSLRRVPSRDYPYSDVCEVLIGTQNEGQNPTGIEAGFNDFLAGKNGFRSGQVDRTGAFLPMRMEGNDQKANHGDDLTLSIDSTIQVAATAALKRSVQTQNADQGVAIAIDPKTGNILALSTWVQGQEKAASNGFNPAIMARFAPGSTFKILTLAEALDLGVLDVTDAVACGGSLPTGYGTAIHCAHGAHGRVDTNKAIARSCNVAATTWARKIGKEEFVEFMTRAGLFQRTGIGLPGEIAGKYNPDDYNKNLQLANMSFGQSLDATPIALCGIFSSLANGGLKMPPRLVTAIGGKPVKSEKPTQLFKPETADTMLGLMEAVIQEDYGTGHSLKIDGYRLGGKTGTAQKLGQGASKSSPAYVSSFVGFVPAQQPRAVILVMIDHPKEGVYYGGAVAGPVFKSIAEAVLKRYNVPRDP
jgi:cell division protein FtsI/penicillin-binding protein 2